MHKFILLIFGLLPLSMIAQEHARPAMMFGDTTRKGVPFSKDPHVVKFNGKYLMYYTLPAHVDKNNPVKGLGIGVAQSLDLTHWTKIGEITPATEPEKNGLAAPCALVIGKQVHLFYQTYGNGPKDAICHAVSDNGIDFKRNPTNPIFRPTGDWNCGRAIDAEVFPFGDRYLLFFATRDSAYKIQMQGVASAPLTTNFNRDQWTLLTNAPILKPEYPWEGQCVEGASIVRRGNTLYMFYAGAYNNDPQQIGVAKSTDGVKWQRLSNKPFLTNGDPGSWNYSESGHPHLFQDEDGKTWLFYQGNNDHGKTWFLSNREVGWNDKGPYLK
jgi:predicted GH43/DUF377 family glycosyl hydrolase